MSNYLPALFGENLMDVFNDFDRDFFRGFWRPEQALYGKNAGHMMRTDVKETETGFEVDVDLPGFKKDEITLDLENGYLTVGASKALDEEHKNAKGRLIRQERYSGSMQRSFYVGEFVTEEEISAKFEDGVLRLTVPKKDAPKLPEKKTIRIE